MRDLVTDEWRTAQAEHARLLAAGRRSRTPLKRRELLEQQAAVLRRLSKHMPKPQLKYAPLLSNAAEGKHVVMFEIARLVGSTVWTLVLPIFLVTCISFAQFGVDPTALHDRLSVTLTCILTIISFQVRLLATRYYVYSLLRLLATRYLRVVLSHSQSHSVCSRLTTPLLLVASSSRPSPSSSYSTVTSRWWCARRCRRFPTAQRWTSSS